MNNNAEVINGLRGLADFLEATPDFPKYTSQIKIQLYAVTKEELTERARMLGKTEKYIADGIGKGDYFGVRRRFSPTVLIEVFSARSKVCKKVKVMREVEEWECPESILNPDALQI